MYVLYALARYAYRAASRLWNFSSFPRARSCDSQGRSNSRRSGLFTLKSCSPEIRCHASSEFSKFHRATSLSAWKTHSTHTLVESSTFLDCLNFDLLELWTIFPFSPEMKKSNERLNFFEQLVFNSVTRSKSIFLLFSYSFANDLTVDIVKK